MEFRHQLSIFDVPHRHVALIVTRHNRIELMIVTSESDAFFMTCLTFLLGLERPKLDRNGSDNNVARHCIVEKSAQDVLRAVGRAIVDPLDDLIVERVPDYDNLVGSQADQVVSFLVDVEALDGSIVTVKVSQLLDCVRFPEDNVTLLTATSHLLVLGRVNKAIDALLVQVERFLFVGQVGRIVHMDEAVK